MANPTAKSEKTVENNNSDRTVDQQAANINVFATPKGILNPHYLIDDPAVLTDPRNNSSTFISLLKKQTKAEQEPQYQDNNGIMRGIVLSVETLESTSNNSQAPNTLETILNSGLLKNTDGLKIVSIRARIPELHRSLPIPSGPDDIDNIKVYPIFTSLDNIAGNETYGIGDIVNLDYENRKSKTGGILLGPIIRAIPQNVTNISCNATYVASPGGQALGTTPNALGHTGEKSAPLRSRDSRKSVAIIGSNGIGGKFGEMIEDYFYSKGYSIVGKSGYSPVERKNNSGGNFRIVQTGLTLPDQILGTGFSDLSFTFKEKPDVIEFQYDTGIKNVANSSNASATKSDNLVRTIAKLKKESGAQEIFVIGAIKKIKDDSGALINPNLWMSFSFIDFGATVIDPISLSNAQGNPLEPDIATAVIKKFISKKVIDVKGPPPEEPEKSDPTQPATSGLLQGLLPEIKTGEEGRDYLLQVASRLGYNTADQAPPDGSKHWRNLSTRDYSTEPLTNEELSVILGLGAPPPAPAGTSNFPDDMTAAMLTQQLGEQLNAASKALKKQEDAVTATAAVASSILTSGAMASFPAPPAGACGAIGFGGVASISVPPGSTYTGPKQLKKNSLNNAVKQRPGKVKSILTIHKATVYKKSDPNWLSALSSMDAVSIKVTDGAGAFRSGGNLEFVKYVQGLGIPVHGWGFNYCRDIQEATREAIAAANMCKKLGLKAYWWNAEKNWQGSSSVPETVDAPGAGMQFMYIFKKNAPGIPVIGNCWSWRKPPGRPHKVGLTDYLISAMDGFSPMCYATTPGTVVNKWVTRGERYAAAGTPFCPMIGTGRIGLVKNGKPEIWGWANDQGIFNGPKYNKKGSPNASGLLTLANQASPKAVWVAYYYGNNTGPMASHGNMLNPPLSKLAAALRAGRRSGIAVGTGGMPAITPSEGAAMVSQDPNAVPFGQSMEPDPAGVS